MADYVADLLRAFDERYREIAETDDEGDVYTREFLRGRKVECESAKRMVQQAIAEGFIRFVRRNEG